MKKKIYFKGYYGFRNLGDDVFCVAADWICNNLWENSEAMFIGKDLPQLSSNAKVYRFDNSIIKKIFELFILIKADKIIYFGGSLLHSKVKGIFDIKYYLNKYKFLYNKLGTIGTSVGPFRKKDDMDSMGVFLNKFRFICVRDYSSINILRNMDISPYYSFCFDPAVLIGDIYPSLKKKKPIEDKKIKLGVSLCHYERYIGGDLNQEKIREKSIELLLDEAVGYDYGISKITFFVFNGGKYIGDAEITNYFYNKYKDNTSVNIVEYTSSTEEFCMRLADCDFILGTRLHSGILAYSLNIPFMLVEYHTKCTEFLNTINHKYRFIASDIENNINNFKLLLKNKAIPGIIPPDCFKEIMLEQLNIIKRELL